MTENIPLVKPETFAETLIKNAARETVKEAFIQFTHQLKHNPMRAWNDVYSDNVSAALDRIVEGWVPDSVQGLKEFERYAKVIALRVIVDIAQKELEELEGVDIMNMILSSDGDK